MTSERLLSSAFFDPNAAELISHCICKPPQMRRVIVVGYQNVETRDGLQLNMATFKNVAGGDKIRITDIKLTGFEDIEDYKENGWTGPMVTKINYLGYTMNDDGMFGEDAVQWLYVYEKIDDKMVGYWYDDFAGDAIDNLEGEKYFLEMGESLWIDMPYAQYGEKIKFVYAGAVADTDNQFTLRDGLCLVGNPMPTAVRITDVDVAGYEKIQEYAENGWTGPMVTKINYLGYTMNDDGMFGEDAVQWLYVYEKIDDKMVGYWYDDFAGDAIDNLEGEKYDIQPGEGLWIDNPYAQYGEKISIIFPSPLVDHTAK